MRIVVLAAAGLFLCGFTQHSADYRALEHSYAAAAAPTIKTMAVSEEDGVLTLRVEGTAPGVWFTEGQFPISLQDSAGKTVSETIVRPAAETENWNGPVAWVADIEFARRDAPTRITISADQEFELEGGETPPAPTASFPMTAAIPPSTETAEAAAAYARSYHELEQAYAAAPAPTITSATPVAGDDMMHLTGTAPGVWFGESQFLLMLEDGAGTVVAQASAHTPEGYDGDFSGAVPWEADVPYVATNAPTMVVLQADEDGEFGDMGPPPAPMARLPLVLTRR